MQIQAPAPTQDKSNEISGENFKAKSIFVRSLASGNDWCICLMGAV
jgi:hypothetical protein